MKTLGIIIFLLLFLAPAKGSAAYSLHVHSLPPDTLPPPPPGNSVPLTGPDQACVGDTSLYYAEVPVACSCQWAVNGSIQPGSGYQFTVVWEEQGMFIVTLTYVCSGGQTSPPQAIPVHVFPVPHVNLGPDTTILQGQSLTLDAGNPGSDYLWSTGQTTQTIEVTQAGNYSVTVTNFCGEDWDDIQVSVITGQPERLPAFDGKIFYDGEFIRIYPGRQKIQHMKISAISGQLFYEGAFIDLYHPEYKGLTFISLFTKNQTHHKKILIP
jgi:hypothetical protein